MRQRLAMACLASHRCVRRDVRRRRAGLGAALPAVHQRPSQHPRRQLAVVPRARRPLQPSASTTTSSTAWPQFEVHMGPRREFAIFKGVQDEHRDHDVARQPAAARTSVAIEGRPRQAAVGDPVAQPRVHRDAGRRIAQRLRELVPAASSLLQKSCSLLTSPFQLHVDVIPPVRRCYIDALPCGWMINCTDGADDERHRLRL